MQAHLERTIARLGEDIDRGLAASDDSPALVDGRFVSTGAFHEIELAAAMDGLAAALARSAETALQRVHRMLDGRVTGLPDQLTPVPGPRCGLVVLHKRGVGVVADLRRCAAPASVGVTDTSLGQEDVQSFGFAAAENLRQAEELAREVLAIELIAARQAWWLRGGGPRTAWPGSPAGWPSASPGRPRPPPRGRRAARRRGDRPRPELGEGVRYSLRRPSP